MRKLSFSSTKIAPYIFISPFFVLFGIFMLFPLVYQFYLSFNGAKYRGYEFTFANYLFLFRDPTFWKVLYNNFFYMAGDTVLHVAISLPLALAVNSVLIKGKKFFRTVFLTAPVISSVVVAAVFLMLLNKEYGLVNALLSRLGLPPVNWLGDVSIVKFTILGVLQWRWMGYYMIFFLAGLQAIPNEFYEAAEIDGANNWHKFWGVTIPLLKPVTAVVVILSIIGALRMFDTPYLLTEGGPVNSSSTLCIQLYKNAFTYYDLSYACAIGAIMFLLMFVITIIQGRFFGIFKKW